MGKGKRVALYLRVSTDGQTTENQRLVLETVAGRRGWDVVQTYSDNGISGAKGRDARPGIIAALKDAARGCYDVLAVWSIDRLGRSTAMVATTLAELDAVGVAIYADKEGMDATTPHGQAMLQMAAVFAELERGMIRERVMAGIARAKIGGTRSGKPFGRPKVSDATEAAILAHLATGAGILKVAHELGVGSGTVQRIKAAGVKAKATAQAVAFNPPSQAAPRDDLISRLGSGFGTSLQEHVPVLKECL